MSYARAMKIAIFSLGFVSTSALLATAAQAASEVKSVPGQYVVELKKSFTHFNLLEIEHSLGGHVTDHVRDDMIVVQRDLSEPRSLGLERLRENAFVAKADPNYLFTITKTPNDPDYGKLWGLSNQGAIDASGVHGLKGVDIGAEKAWDKTTGSKDVIVAVIDTGIDFKIPDLAENAWINKVEAAGKAGVDDDGNGYVDDINGYNFADNKGDATDDNGHGSHCSGTIGGRGNDGAGIAGINWKVSLMAVKFLDSKGGGTLANSIKAIDYARKNGAQVLSNSWGGGPFTQTLFEAIQETQKAGALFIAAAGNDGSNNDVTPAFPASYKIDNIISVAALDHRGELASFSNYGALSVHLAAPGVEIFSTTPKGFEFMSGTSMATPHVAGAAALLLAENPHLSYVDLKQRLIAGSRPLHALKGKLVSGGMLDISYALSGVTPPEDPNDASRWINTLAQSVSSPHPYGDKLNQTATIHVPGATRLAVHFSRFETEKNYDTVQFFNGSGDLVGTFSGAHSGDYSPIVEGDTIVLKATSDASVNGYGFDVDSAAFEKSAVP